MTFNVVRAATSRHDAEEFGHTNCAFKWDFIFVAEATFNSGKKQSPNFIHSSNYNPHNLFTVDLSWWDQMELVPNNYLFSFVI
jgi:hypothetical protein